jgi:hypothetical protein
LGFDGLFQQKIQSRGLFGCSLFRAGMFPSLLDLLTDERERMLFVAFASSGYEQEDVLFLCAVLDFEKAPDNKKSEAATRVLKEYLEDGLVCFGCFCVSFSFFSFLFARSCSWCKAKCGNEESYREEVEARKV